jgi:branched-subunit amino acid aminotransferase/4-amino-4-deoxychorismate lyase
LGVPHAERTIRPEQLPKMDGVFLSLSSRGIVEAVALEGAPLRRSPLTRRLQEEFETVLARECR